MMNKLWFLPLVLVVGCASKPQFVEIEKVEKPVVQAHQEPVDHEQLKMLRLATIQVLWHLIVLMLLVVLVTVLMQK
jgi:hypothetical protein